MKEIIFLHLDTCPYCRQAVKAMDELKAAEPKYTGLKITWIEESREAEKAKAYAKDYYYVPTMFVGGTKMYEAHPGESYEECKAHVAEVFAAASK